MRTCRGDALLTEEAFWPKELLLPGGQERWEEGLSGVPGAAVLPCLLEEETGVEFPKLHHPFLGQSRVEENLGGRSGSKGLDIVEALWIPHSWVSPHS